MRISDWSSDVCSSDLADVAGGAADIHDDGVVDTGQEGGAAHAVGGAGTDGEYGMPRRFRRRDQRAVVLGDIEGRGKAETGQRSEEHTSELQSLMRISYAVFWLIHNNNRAK